MKVSIITVCYNSEKYIKSAIDSVLNQSYQNIEYIIIDGDSKDNTVNIINSYGSRITKFISEPDKGIYDAMNKGLKIATGNLVGILNSDDFYFDNTIIENVVREINEKKTDSLFADIIYVYPENTDRHVRYWRAKPFKSGSFQKGWHPGHPAFFVKRDAYLKYGYFLVEFTLAADFELMLRFIERFKISTVYLPKPLVKMRLGGASNKNIKNMFIQNIECFKAFKANNINVSIFYPFLRLFPKLIQFFRKTNE